MAPHIRLAILLMFSTACRPAATLNLTWDRVNFDREQIDLRTDPDGPRRRHHERGAACRPRRCPPARPDRIRDRLVQEAGRLDQAGLQPGGEGCRARRGDFCGCRPLCKRFRLIWSRDRVRTSVRPLCAALSGAAGRYGEARIGSKSPTRALTLRVTHWFSRSGSIRSCAHAGRRLLTPPSPARGRAALRCGHAATACAGSL